MCLWKKKNKRRCTVAVSPAFLALLLVFAAADRQRLLVHILLAAAVHEAGHAAAVHLAGGEIALFRITLFGAEMRIRRSERLSYGREILSVLAGPGVNLLCALVLGRVAGTLDWEAGYAASGIHAALALFNLLPVRPLDGGRIFYLLLCWRVEPVTAERAMGRIDRAFLCAALFGTALLQGMTGPQLPLLMLELWFIFCWCRETGIVKPLRTG